MSIINVWSLHKNVLYFCTYRVRCYLIADNLLCDNKYKPHLCNVIPSTCFIPLNGFCTCVHSFVGVFSSIDRLGQFISTSENYPFLARFVGAINIFFRSILFVVIVVDWILKKNLWLRLQIPHQTLIVLEFAAKLLMLKENTP